MWLRSIWTMFYNLWQGILTKKHIVIQTMLDRKTIHINLPFSLLCSRSLSRHATLLPRSVAWRDKERLGRRLPALYQITRIERCGNSWNWNLTYNDSVLICTKCLRNVDRRCQGRGHCDVWEWLSLTLNLCLDKQERSVSQCPAGGPGFQNTPCPAVNFIDVELIQKKTNYVVLCFFRSLKCC